MRYTEKYCEKCNDIKTHYISSGKCLGCILKLKHSKAPRKAKNRCQDCNKIISYGATFCKSCVMKGKRHPMYKNGYTLREKYCIDCGVKVSSRSEKKEHRCPKCAHKIVSYETRVKQSIARGGDGNLPVIKEEKTFFKDKYVDYDSKFTPALKKEVRTRDNHTCQICKESGCKLYVHHIDYDKTNSSKDNLITLCNSCHAKTNFNREYWVQYFTGVVVI